MSGITRSSRRADRIAGGGRISRHRRHHGP
jgi:hypothetical protein